MKNYDSTTYWNYIMAFDANCPSLRGNETGLDSCWKSAATQAGIDTSSVQACANSTYAFNALQADEQLSNQNNVQGSPTLFVNNVLYNGDRSSTAFQQAICGSFTNPPAGCSQNVTSAKVAAAGGCGS